MMAEVCAAILILKECFDQCEAEGNWMGVHLLERVMRRLAYPDRAVYPKVRGSKKSDPVTNVKPQGYFSRGWS